MLEASVDDVVSDRQLYRAHAALFVCAYVGFAAYFAVTDPDNPVAVLLRDRAQTKEQSQLFVATPSPVAPANRVAIPAAAARNNSVADETASTVAPEAEVRQQEHARLNEVRLQATRAEQPQDRAQAIDQLNAATPETLQALQAVVTSDSAIRNRIRALNSLRVIGEQDGAKDAVISIVHLAMVDTNASVASRASEVYRELTPEQTAE